MFEPQIIKEMQGLIGADSETMLMCEKYGSTPPPICFTYATADKNGQFDTSLFEVAAEDHMKQSLVTALESGKKILFHNASFDLGVAMNEWPDLAPMIFKALDDGRVHCTAIREKFLNLAEFGEIQELIQHGTRKVFDYSLAGLVMEYLNKDISGSKKDSDSWRTNYEVLMDLKATEWPKEAVEYAEMDAVYVLPIFAYQEIRAKKLEKANGVHPFAAERIRVQIAFALGLMGNAGLYVDTEKSVLLDKFLAEDLAPERLNKMFDAEKGLVDYGILIPSKPAMPYAKKTLDHLPSCPGNKTNPNYIKNKRITDCGCPVKMKKAQPEKTSTKKLEDFMIKLSEQDPRVKIRRGKPTEIMIAKAQDKGIEPVGNIKTDGAWFDDFAEFHPVLQQYQYREKEGKIRSDYIKKLVPEGQPPATIIRANFDILKRSGRVSSYGGTLYPSWNCQNVDPRIRTCCYAPEGWLLLSSDYNAMELGTAAQTCINVVGYSVMADVINSGRDVHAYLGSRIAYETNNDFNQLCSEMKVKGQDEIYKLFMSTKSSDDPDVRAFFKKYRKFAKPTGLGYPGGLGPETFVTYAKQTFGVIVDLDMANKLRDIWRELFPEFPEYHKYITQNCEDYRLGPVMVKDKKNPEKMRQMKKFKYTTPMGMMRPGCDFTKIANGMCMQSPSSEGSLIGGYEIIKECFDPSMGSILFGNLIPIAPIHDEYLSYVRESDDLQEVIKRKEQIMVDNMRKITPDVAAGVESALMRRWFKFAEPVYDDDMNLMVWEPGEHDTVWLDEKIKKMKGENE